MLTTPLVNSWLDAAEAEVKMDMSKVKTNLFPFLVALFVGRLEALSLYRCSAFAHPEFLAQAHPARLANHPVNK